MYKLIITCRKGIMEKLKGMCGGETAPDMISCYDKEDGVYILCWTEIGGYGSRLREKQQEVLDCLRTLDTEEPGSEYGYSCISIDDSNTGSPVTISANDPDIVPAVKFFCEPSIPDGCAEGCVDADINISGEEKSKIRKHITERIGRYTAGGRQSRIL